MTRGPDPAEYFAHLTAAYGRAAAETGVAERRFDVAGRPVAIEVAGGAALEPVTAALAHLAGGGGKPPSLTVLVADGASSGFAPPLAWRAEHVREAGVIEPLSDRRFHTVALPRTGILSMVDLDRRLAVCWLRDAAALPAAERAAPLRRVLHSWLATEGVVFAHAGAVGTAQGGVLLTGPGGSGKSTTALAGLDAGLLFAGDDYCALEPGAKPAVHSLYSSAKVDPAELEHLRGLSPALAARPGPAAEKSLLQLHPRFGDRLVRRLDLRAILLPRIAAAPDTSLRPASRGAVLRALAPTSVLLSGLHGGRALERLSEVAAAVPGFELLLGEDRRQGPAAIAELLSPTSATRRFARRSAEALA